VKALKPACFFWVEHKVTLKKGKTHHEKDEWAGWLYDRLSFSW